eukprot:TRINITY_DN7203_c0_g1_i1.p1 TRINITY_DN7203_c0_g1~~TRINITY_DN7203_c0_g1_i1.p1  ORF type:complete len:159 (-),score=15.62 TRINITY_DN7203_c0_g1_i1:90-566(-)
MLLLQLLVLLLVCFSGKFQRIDLEDLSSAAAVAAIGPFDELLTLQAFLQIPQFTSSYGDIRNSDLLSDGGRGDIYPLPFSPSLAKTSQPQITSNFSISFQFPKDVIRPDSNETLLLLPLITIGGLLRNGELTSVELTQIALNRLKQLDEYLEQLLQLI